MRKIFKSGETPLLPILFVCILFLLTSCGSSQESEEENVLIYAALNPVTRELESEVEIFNRTHSTKIVIHDYSDEGGVERLKTELMLGQVPDIMEMQRLGRQDFRLARDMEVLWYETIFDADLSDCFWMPYRQMVQKGYLEDLWPYIDNDPQYYREKIVEAPLKAAEVDGGLYMIPKYVSVSTLAGPTRVVGDRIGWTLEDLIEAFSTMPSGSKLLRHETTRWDVYINLVAPLLDQYIDWGTGTCSFGSQEFRDTLEFLSLFPVEDDKRFTGLELDKENYYLKADGYRLLEPMSIYQLGTIMNVATEFGEPISLVGYPTADGSSGSSFIFHGRPLAMSTSCKDKEAAWDFIRRYLRPETKSTSGIENLRRNGSLKIPLNKIEYRLMVMENMEHKYTSWHVLYPSMDAPLALVPYPTDKDAKNFYELVDNTTLLFWPENQVSEAVWNAVGPYFAGDKTMDETIDLVQRRVRLYVNEQR